MTEQAINPFRIPRLGPTVQAIDAQSRLNMVKEFGTEELRAVMGLPDVQKTVRRAAERRLKKLEAQG